MQMRMPVNSAAGIVRWLVVASVFVVCTVVWAQPREQSLIVAQGLDPRGLSPLGTTAQQEKNVSGQVVERLMNFSYDGEDFVPILAESWEMIAPDTLQIRLREGIAFTNGEPFDAEAAKFSLDMLMDSFAYESFVSHLSSAEVVGPYTVNLKAARPTPERLMLMALAMGGFMYPPVYTKEVGLLEGFARAPIGTGPFLLESWVKDSRIVLKSNPEYWGGEPNIPYLVFVPISIGAARVAALEAGDVDLAIDVPLDAFTRVDRNPNVVAVSAPGGRAMAVTYASKPEWGGPLTDAKVRKALQHAVDVEAIVETLLSGEARILQGQALTPNMFGYNPNLAAVPYDPELAQRLLAEAGYGDGVSLTFKYPAGRYAQDKEISEAIAGMLSEVGVNVNQVVLEPGEWLNQLLALELRDMHYGGGLPPPDAHFAMVEFGCDFLYSYACVPEIDRLTALAQYETDEARRLEMYHQITQIVYDEALNLYLFAPNDLYGHSVRVRGWEPSLDQFLDFSGVSLD